MGVLFGALSLRQSRLSTPTSQMVKAANHALPCWWGRRSDNTQNTHNTHDTHIYQHNHPQKPKSLLLVTQACQLLSVSSDACACAWARRREIGETERGPSSPPPPSSARCPDERLNAVRPTLNWAPMLRGAPECRGFATRNDPEMQTAGTSSLWVDLRK